jgi:hypothetical protein
MVCSSLSRQLQLVACGAHRTRRRAASRSCQLDSHGRLAQCSAKSDAAVAMKQQPAAVPAAACRVVLHHKAVSLSAAAAAQQLCMTADWPGV